MKPTRIRSLSFGNLGRPWLQVGLHVALFYALYFIYFGRHFFSGSAIFIGDSHGTISLNNLAAWALIEHSEFLWWDPSALNGFPSFVHLTHGWFNYMGPLALPGQAVGYLLVQVFGLSIPHAVQIQLSSVPFVLALLFVILLSRELIDSRPARLLPPLIFTLGVSTNQMFMLSQHGAALAPSLIYLFGLVYWYRRRTEQALYVLYVCLIAFVASINYITMSSHFFPLVIFTALLLLFNRGAVIVAWRVALRSLCKPEGRVIASLAAVSLFIAAANIGITLYFLSSEIIRLPQIAALNVDYGVKGLAGLMETVGGGIGYQTILTAFNQWAPFDDIYRFVLLDEPPGDLYIPRVDMRYIGIVTVPLLVAALIYGRLHGIVVPLLLAYFLCTYLLPYTVKLEPFMYLLEKVEVMRNTRNMAHMMPRDIPTVMALLLAGMGLDAVVRSSVTESKGLSQIFKLFVFGVLAFCAAVAVMLYLQKLAQIRHSMAHISVYLAAGSLTILAVLFSRKSTTKLRLAYLLIFIALADLSVSSSYYWQRVATTLPKAPLKLLPDPTRFEPITQEEKNWFRGHTGSYVHEVGPYMPFGLRAWLVLATRDAWLPTLENWNPRSGAMTEYPAFRFFNSATFIPFERISEIDSVSPPNPDREGFYIHDRGAVEGMADKPRKLQPKWSLLDFTPNRVRLSVEMPEPGFVLHLDNFDRFWTAVVNGKATAVHRANFTFKAVKLSAGPSVLEMVYNPYPVKWGWIAFYAAFVALLVVLAVSWRRKR